MGEVDEKTWSKYYQELEKHFMGFYGVDRSIFLHQAKVALSDNEIAAIEKMGKEYVSLIMHKEGSDPDIVFKEMHKCFTLAMIMVYISRHWQELCEARAKDFNNLMEICKDIDDKAKIQDAYIARQNVALDRCLHQFGLDFPLLGLSLDPKNMN